MSKQKSVPVTWEKYKTTKLAYYESPDNFLRNDVQEDQFFLNDRTKANTATAWKLMKDLGRISKVQQSCRTGQKIMYH